jgi:serine/threonine-protein kinase
LLAGDYRDPLVGRDLLIGSLTGAFFIALSGLGRIAPNWIGQVTPIVNTPATPILHAHLFFHRFAFQLAAGLFLGFICVFLLLLFVAVLRSETLSLIALGILLTIMGTLISESSLIMVPFTALSSFILVIVMRRYGLLALCAALFVAHLYVFFPITTELTAWYATDFTIALVICVVMAVYAAYTAVGGAKVFAEKI